jgi:hypothetical protein
MEMNAMTDGYGWQTEADRQAGSNAPRLPDGIHRVEIKRVLHGSQNTPEFRSNNGDPQIMLIYGDDQGREVGDMITLSERAGWRLAKVLSAGGANLKGMEADGVLPEHFADEKFAQQLLRLKPITISVRWSKTEKGKDVADCEVVQDAPAQQAQQAPPDKPATRNPTPPPSIPGL